MYVLYFISIYHTSLVWMNQGRELCLVIQMFPNESHRPVTSGQNSPAASVVANSNPPPPPSSAASVVSHPIQTETDKTDDKKSH